MKPRRSIRLEWPELAPEPEPVLPAPSSVTYRDAGSCEYKLVVDGREFPLTSVSITRDALEVAAFGDSMRRFVPVRHTSIRARYTGDYHAFYSNGLLVADWAGQHLSCEVRVESVVVVCVVDGVCSIDLKLVAVR